MYAAATSGPPSSRSSPSRSRAPLGMRSARRTPATHSPETSPAAAATSSQRGSATPRSRPCPSSHATASTEAGAMERKSQRAAAVPDGGSFEVDDDLARLDEAQLFAGGPLDGCRVGAEPLDLPGEPDV